MTLNPKKNFDRPLDEQIKIVDELTLSPEQRAMKVHKAIAPHVKEFTNWDMLCYCLHFLNAQATLYEWLLPVMKPVNRMIYNAHYYFADDLGLLTDDKPTASNRESSTLSDPNVP